MAVPVPLFGLVLLGFALGLIATNVLVAIVRPELGPTLMGLQLFVGGMLTLMVAVADVISPLGISPTERFIVFGAGSLDCFIAYYMVLREGG